MFVRCKKNKSGTTSVQIIDKSSGKYVVFKTIGSSANKIEIDFLIAKANKIVASHGGQSVIAFDKDKELEYVDTFLQCLESMQLVGPELLLGTIFDSIGFNAIEDELFRHLVITRLVYPVSKLKTTDYLFKYRGKEISVYSIYRYLDKLYDEQIELVKSISFSHTLQLLNGIISVAFYDVTTLYFEASSEDDLRKTGFSKDGKHQCPQIVLGLLVSENGYPLDYEIFEGNKYEGDTLLPVLNHFKKKYKFEKLIVIADAGLLSNKNIECLKTQQYQYILGARLKNMNKDITSKIVSLQLNDNQSDCITISKKERLVVGYKSSRSHRDEKNRKRGLEKLEKAIQSNKLGKKHINNRGYNKYLQLEGEVNITINYSKFEDDAKWDGLKGYVTNTQLTKEEVIAQYGQLWQIERTFRISKSDLQIRPIYHRLEKRIVAHICISFVACKVYKELERLLKEKQSDLSASQAIDIVKTIYKIELQTPYSNNKYSRLLLKTEEQKSIIKLFNLKI